MTAGKKAIEDRDMKTDRFIAKRLREFESVRYQ